MKKNKVFFKRLFAMTLATTMAITLAPQNLLQTFGVKTQAEAATPLRNPRIVSDSSMEAGQKVTWDCIYFGSYPQTEIVDQASRSGCYRKVWESDGDYEVNTSLYTSLQNATTYDANGDIIIENTKYRRIQKADATYYGTSGDSGFYKWSDSTTYHYFRYEPIKWRVLKTTGSQALLLADKVLDDQLYDISNTSITWKTCTMRSWLNGYGSSSNTYGTNYSSKNFIDTAFNSSEKSAIATTSVVNDNNIYNSTAGGNDTSDKIFLLSESEVYNTNQAKAYGFVTSYSTEDEARRMKSTSYAKAMGTWSNYRDGVGYDGNCWWWLLSPGDNTDYTACVGINGSVYNIGNDVCLSNNSCCPALNLNLSSSNLWSFAGEVCSDGKIDEKAESGSTIHTHSFGNWITKAATVFATGMKTRKCSICGATQKSTLAKLTPTIKLSKTKVTLKKKKSITIKVTKLAKGDSVKSWKTSKKAVATVNNKGKIVAKKKGKANITVTLKSGKKAVVKVTVK